MSHGFHSNSRWKSGITKAALTEAPDESRQADMVRLLCVLHRVVPRISPSSPFASLSTHALCSGVCRIVLVDVCVIGLVGTPVDI